MKKFFHHSVVDHIVNLEPHIHSASGNLALTAITGNKRRLLISLLLLLLLFLSFPSLAQSQDTIPIKSKTDSTTLVHSPRKATIYSLVLPGLGQAYNHKYWKIPIVYAGFGTTIYFVQFNHKLYKDFRDAYAFSSSGSTGTPPNDLVTKYASAQLLVGRDYYRRNLEVSWIATGVWYLLTVVDATVDAYFFDYNINEDLSLQVKPWIAPPVARFKQSGGLTFSMRF